jgi:hypothetical protein
MPDNDTIPCAQCGAPLARDSFGLDTYDEGYSILPEGKFLEGDAVCVGCYERTYSNCDVCDVECEGEGMERVEVEGDTLHTCEGCARVLRARIVAFHGFDGGEWCENERDDDDARVTLARFVREQRKRGRPVVRIGKARFEIQEPDDAAMVPDWAGTIRIEPAPLPKYWTRSMRRAAGR